jgi:plastocyanin
MRAVSRGLREASAALLAVIATFAFASTASAAPSELAAKAGGLIPGTRMVTSEDSTVTTTKLPNGAKRLTYSVGPFNIIPGQNEIGYAPIVEKPKVDGWITRMRPDLVYVNGKIPRVDVLHLHHGVWVNLSGDNATSGLPQLFFAAGEEKTIFQMPKGFGYRYEADDRWLLNHMIHNLTPVPAKVKMIYEIDFIPDSSKAARKIKPVRPIWMDVENGKLYPVFNVEKNSGDRGKRKLFTYPNDDADAYTAGEPERNKWVVDRPGVLVATAGHLHPGGLHTDLWLERDGAKVRAAKCGRFATARAARRCRAKAPRGRGDKVHLFESRAKYFEPAGAVSWDVAMTATRPDWRVKLRKGDVLSTTATYTTDRAAWWESMGIMVAYMADSGPGKNPYRQRVDLPGKPTHGHLYENRNHGGKKTSLPDPRKLPSGAENPGNVDILGFNYRLGDLRLPGQAGRPPVITPGQSLNFVNQDNGKRYYHSVTSCKAPCNRSTGIAYPIADGPVQFESGTLGTDRPVAIGSTRWRTPTNLKAGTYTYFCRIHPFMRGAFRVKK